MIVGLPITRRTCERMPECQMCGQRPAIMPRWLHPRRVEDPPAVLHASSPSLRHPGVHIVCGLCGAGVEGRSFAEALNRWRKRARPRTLYLLPGQRLDERH